MDRAEAPGPIRSPESSSPSKGLEVRNTLEFLGRSLQGSLPNSLRLPEALNKYKHAEQHNNVLLPPFLTKDRCNVHRRRAESARQQGHRREEL